MSHSYMNDNRIPKQTCEWQVERGDSGDHGKDADLYPVYTIQPVVKPVVQPV